MSFEDCVDSKIVLTNVLREDFDILTNHAENLLIAE